MTAEKRVQEYISEFSVEVLNLVMERHNLSNEKRSWFSIRFASEDSSVEKECTEKMDELDKKIYKIDDDLLSHYGIDKKLRTQMIKDLKKSYPKGWIAGFGE
ncbi:hypothetical protein [Pseudalkalibacillus hwajinpoensis]|uniref:hypothetical protein n=1 Tax=Guptibacillus hwajinpoensis TaxID=208199 RepID=UPI00384CF9BE